MSLLPRYGSTCPVAESLGMHWVLRPTLPAPDIAEAILDGRQPPGMQLDQLLRPLPTEWNEQRLDLSSG